MSSPDGRPVAFNCDIPWHPNQPSPRDLAAKRWTEESVLDDPDIHWVNRDGERVDVDGEPLEQEDIG